MGKGNGLRGQIQREGGSRKQRQYAGGSGSKLEAEGSGGTQALLNLKVSKPAKSIHHQLFDLSTSDCLPKFSKATASGRRQR